MCNGSVLSRARQHCRDEHGGSSAEPSTRVLAARTHGDPSGKV